MLIYSRIMYNTVITVTTVIGVISVTSVTIDGYWVLELLRSAQNCYGVVTL